MRLSHSQVTRAGDENSGATPQIWVKGLRFKMVAMKRSRNAEALPYGKRAHPRKIHLCLDDLSDSGSRCTWIARGVTAMDTKCVRCGRKVRLEENWLRAHLWASTAVFHWNCFIALMKSHGETGAEQVTWQGDGHAPPSVAEAPRGKRR